MEHDRLKTLYQRYRTMNGFLVYDLEPEDRLLVGIDGARIDGIQAEPDRIIEARILNKESGLLQVVMDSVQGEESWTLDEINLGSFSGEIARIPTATPGLLRGFIQEHAGVVADFSGRHFEASEPAYLLANYGSLAVNGHFFF